MNTNAKHTPGPWENHKWNCEEHQISAKGGTIALVSHSHSLVSEAEADANARLIAAAPILAEYLAELLEATETLARRHGTPLSQCHQYAKAALAKAEGGAQ
jgi:hypothetical protein